MKPAIISSLTAQTGDFFTKEGQYQPYALNDPRFVGNGCIDATDFLPSGGLKNDPLFFEHDSAYCGYVTHTTLRERATA